MDWDKELAQLREKADRTVLRDLHFTSAMEQRVKQRIGQSAGLRRRLLRATTGAAAGLAALWALSLLGSDLPRPFAGRPDEMRQEVTLPDAVWSPPTLWQPSPRHVGMHEGVRFDYLGEKPVRLIAGELYAGQIDKVIWLLDGTPDHEVQVQAVHESGQRLDLGKWLANGALYDAAAHFPAGLLLPSPGIWKLQVLADGKQIGQVFVSVRPGISPANRELVQPLVEAYVRAQWPGEGMDTDIELYGVEAPTAADRTVYAWVSHRPSDPLSSAGIEQPMIFTIRYAGNRYEVTQHWAPDAGDGYWPSIEARFPPEIAKQIRQRAGVR